MSPRRSPIKHPVKPHTRSGRPVRQHEKGSGSRNKKASKSSSTRRGSGFNVSLFFTGKPRETVNVGGNTYTEATKQGLKAMRTPSVPVRMQLRRRKKTK